MENKLVQTLFPLFLLLCIPFLVIAQNQNPDFEEGFEGVQAPPPSDYLYPGSQLWGYSGNKLQTLTSEEVNEQDQSVRFEVNASDQIPYRSELVFKSMIGYPIPKHMPVGTEWWHGISIYVPPNWQADVVGEIVLQFHGVPDPGEQSRNPPLSIRILGDQWVIHQLTDSAVKTTKGDYDYDQDFEVAPVDTGWTHWVIRTLWAYNSQGITQFWKDGVLIYDLSGIGNTFNDQLGPYLKFGIYKSLWKKATYRNKSAAIGITQRVYYHDNLRIAQGANRYADVVPDGIPENAFPVDWLSFDVAPDPRTGRIGLNWQTSEEINNAMFTVERSVDGYFFEPIGDVDPQSGPAESIRSYESTDYAPANGRNYYRIRQTDFDGTFSYSNTVEVEFESSEVGFLKVMPNLIQPGGSVHIEGRLTKNGPAMLIVRDMIGRSVYQQPVENIQGSIRCQIPNLPLQSGTYLVEIRRDQERYVQQLLVH